MAARFGRLRRGATTTAVAAVAVAALSASQAPGITHASAGEGPGPQGAAPDAPVPPGGSATGDSPYYTDLPPLRTPDKPVASIDLPVTGPAEAGIPASVLAAYKRAEQTIAASDPGCRVPWQLLAAIGKVESGQARGGKVDANGTTFSPILGPVLNGVGFANISDTDNGAYDGDTRYDRAVGPMQFIPSTWATWGQDANGDGRRDPNNIYDAALAAGRYLCAGNRDLTVKADLDQAILSYNRSREYLRTVLSWFEYYKRGTHAVPDGTGVLPDSSTPDSGSTTPTQPEPVRSETLAAPSPGGNTPAKPGPSEPAAPAEPGKSPTEPRPAEPAEVAPLPPTTLVNAGATELSGTAGETFSEQVAMQVRNALGKGIANQKVRFDITGTTEAAFEGGKKSAVAVTGSNGRAAAPALSAGEKTGAFIVRATVVGHKVPAVDIRVQVTPRVADAVVVTAGQKMTAAPDSQFAETITITAFNQKRPAAGVAVTAMMVQSPDTPPVENDNGPHFKEGNDTIRTLSGLKTDANGVLSLPDIFTDSETGTFHLLLTLAGGKTVTVELTVAAPAAPTPTASSSPAS
jgi:hypothetical protein